MAFRDLSEFLKVLKSERALIEIDRYIDLDLEVGKVLRKLNESGGPAVVFNNTGSAFRLVAGLFSTRRLAALAFGTSEAELTDLVLHGLEAPIKAEICTGSAPAQENTISGDEIDIGKFPIPRYSPEDGGRFITPGIVVSRDPETGITDLGHYRFQVVDQSSMAFLAQPFHRFGKNIAKARALGWETYDAALVVGTEPILAYSCQVQGTDATDDYAVAGGLRGEPVSVVRATAIDLDVPATAEVVFELEVQLKQEALEGPLAEYTGYYTGTSRKPVARVKAVTHRKDAYFQGLLTGKPVTENHLLKQVPFEASLRRDLQSKFPTISDVAILASAGVAFMVVVAMTPRFVGEARQVMLAAFASNVRPKWVIVTDRDIDIRKSSDVEWALAFRVQPARDVIVMDGMPAGSLDPSVDLSLSRERRSSSVIGIDATRPVGEAFPAVADIPGWRDVEVPELASFDRR